MALKDLKNELGRYEYREAEEQLDTNKCPFCSCQYLNEPYEFESNRFGFACGLRYHLSYITVTGFDVGVSSTMQWKIVIDVLEPCQYENISFEIGNP